jgi:hypothetical protein
MKFVDQSLFLVARAKKQALKPKRAGRKLPGSPFFVSASDGGQRDSPV